MLRCRRVCQGGILLFEGTHIHWNSSKVCCLLVLILIALLVSASDDYGLFIVEDSKVERAESLISRLNNKMPVLRYRIVER